MFKHASPMRVAMVAAAVLVFSAVLFKLLRGAREGFAQAAAAAAGPTYGVVAPDQQRPMPEPERPMPELDLQRCSADCCAAGKGSGLTCGSGCVCANPKNAELLASRGGNKTAAGDEEF